MHYICIRIQKLAEYGSNVFNFRINQDPPSSTLWKLKFQKQIDQKTVSALGFLMTTFLILIFKKFSISSKSRSRRRQNGSGSAALALTIALCSRQPSTRCVHCTVVWPRTDDLHLCVYRMYSLTSMSSLYHCTVGLGVPRTFTLNSTLSCSRAIVSFSISTK